MLKLARPIPQLTAEQVVILTLLKLANRAVKPDVIERCMGPRGKRFSIANPLELLEDNKLVTRPTPPGTKHAVDKYAINEDGAAVLAEAITAGYAGRVLKELDKRIAKLSTPHDRDGSCLDADAMAPYRYLRALLKGEAKFTDGRQVDAEIDEDGPDGAWGGPQSFQEDPEPEYVDEDEEALGELQEPRQKPQKGSLAYRQAKQRRKATEKRVPVRTQDPRSQAQPARRPARPAAASSAGGPAAGSPQRPKPQKVRVVQTSQPAGASQE